MADTETSWWSMDTVAVVTGANKGIGYEIVRQLAQKGLTVVLTARDPARGKAATDALNAEGLETVAFHELEVTSTESVDKLATWIKHQFGGFDILVNNAGLLAYGTDYETAKYILDVNYYGTIKVTEGLLPLLRASPAGARIVNNTSGVALYERLEGESLKKQLRAEENYSKEFANALAAKYLDDVKDGRHVEEGWLGPDKAPMYSESKIFMNIYFVALANSLAISQPEGHQVFVTTFAPGVTRTALFDLAASMGHRISSTNPAKTPAEGADTGVWLAVLPKEALIEKNGKFFENRHEYAFGRLPK